MISRIKTTTSADVVVFIEGKHLGFVGIAIVKGTVHDRIDIMHKGRTPDGSGVLGQIAAASDHTVGECNVRVRSRLLGLPDARGHLLR